MAPERSSKRQKTDQSTNGTAQTTEPAQVPLPADTPASNAAGNDNSTSESAQQSSWYASWSRSTPPVAQLARGSIKVASDATAEVMSKAPSSIKTRSIRSPSLAMTLGKKQPNRALPADATTTMVHATSANRNPSRKDLARSEVAEESRKEPPRKEKPVAITQEDESRTEPPKKDAPIAISQANKVTSTDEPVTKPSKVDTQDERKQPGQADIQPSRAGWLGWLGASETPQAGGSPDSVVATPPVAQDTAPKAQSVPESAQPAAETSEIESSTIKKGKTIRRSWLPWGTEEEEASAPAPAPAKTSSMKEPTSEVTPSDPPPTETQESQLKSSKPPSIEVSPPPNLPHDASKASAWAFWSRDRTTTGSTTSVDKPHKGEMAVSDTPSQAKPERASINLNESSKKMPEQLETESKADKGQAKKEEDDASIKRPKKMDPTTTIKAESSNATAVAQEPVEDKKPVSIRSSKNYKNLLLPGFQSTLKLPHNPSIVQQLARLLHITKEPELQHLSLVRDPPRIKNALAIGVHGFFPAPLLRTVLGQPTGTSIKFADMAAKSIKRWTKSHGYECQVKTAALEGEGKISERLELLWKLLINWIDEINKADFVLVACHSQGVPVAIMLVAKLIQFGCVASAKIGICAMAGVNMGPFAEYKSRWISGSAGELFEFSHPNSRVSTDYLAALETVLKSGVCVTFVGSIDDQLVSLDSSIFSPISHPHIYRAVSIDAKVHAPNFLSHLVGFALKLRNLGVQDHGLIRELSPPLAGSLYTGEGHSRIYEDDAVYDLAVAFALETNSMIGIPPVQRSSVSGAGNPYILPFAMRGILEEDFVKNELQGEASELLRQFDEWKPSTKVLKDVKFRLEGIRSKL